MGKTWEHALRAVSRASLGLRFFQQGACKGTSARLEAAGISSVGASEYLSGALSISAILALAAAVNFFPDALEALAAFLLLSSVFFAAFIALPLALCRRKSQLCEAELPFLLREFSVYLDIGMPFEKCMEKIGDGNYALSPVFSKGLREVKSGATMQSALAAMSLGTQSLAAKRCFLLLSSIYESGGPSEVLKRTADGLSAAQLSSLRTSGSRLSLLAIVFIATSALAPSFFAVFLAAGPLLFAQSVPGIQIWLWYAIFFPSVNALLLLLSFFLLPPLESSPRVGREMADEFLARAGFPYGLSAFGILVAAASLAISIALFAGGQPAFAALFICAAPCAHFFVLYLAGREVSEAEGRLPDALHSAASVHRLLSSERMLSFLATGGFGRLSEAFALALRRQKAGESFQRSLSAAYAHCPSTLVARSLSLLSSAYETGAAMHVALREAASDVASFHSLVRERAALLSIQRYTLLSASALFVPFILGTAVSLLPSLLPASMQAEGGFPPELYSACQLYVLINALLSSLLLALSESSPQRSAPYFLVVAPLSQAAFLFAVSGGLMQISG